MPSMLLPGTVLAVLVFAGTSHAVPLTAFDCLTESNGFDCAIGENQISGSLFLEGDQTLLVLSNEGDEDAVIARVYLDSEFLTGIEFIEGTGVDFSPEANPPVLPGGAQTFTVSVSSGALPAPPKNGIGPGESATFRLDLADGASFEDLLGDLGVGIHVIAYESGGSESFAASVPEPASTLLLLISGAATVLRKRRIQPPTR